MKVGVLCEFSGIVRDAFIRRGHDAVSCDLLWTARPGPHIRGDCLAQDWTGFDLLICHPPCTHLAVAGAKHFKRKAAKQEAALQFVRDLLALPCPRIALENPVSVISTVIRKPDQIIHPWMFGHDVTKTTCLWLKGLPPLTPTRIIPATYLCRCGHRFAEDLGKYGCANCNGANGAARLGRGEYVQCKSGKRLPAWYSISPGPMRHRVRSATFAGIAEAMAEQWGCL